MTKKRILIFIVAYNHAKLIESVLSRIPKELTAHETEILIIDDASQDLTFEAAEAYKKQHNLPYKITVLVNPKNQRYGGNQKIGFHYAIENNYDILALVHGDGQYTPEALPQLLAPILSGETDAVMGSRMADRFGALKGGMPLYKYVGNKVLTAYQNFVLGTNLFEFHTGYRLYSIAALKRIPFDLVTNEFHFDNEIYIQFLLAGERFEEIGIDTFYGDEVCNVDGFRYAWDIMKTTAIAKLQGTSMFYRQKYDLPLNKSTAPESIPSKRDFHSSHSSCIDDVPANSRVLNVGVDGGHIAQGLLEKGCKVSGIDDSPASTDIAYENYQQVDLRDDSLPSSLKDFDVIILGDVIGRFEEPEKFLATFAERARLCPELQIVATSGNVVFISNRILAALGRFNYGKRGILSRQHRRLFSINSLKSLFGMYGFEIVTVKGIPAPFPLLFGDNIASKALLAMNNFLIFFSKGLFAYQVQIEVRPRPALAWLLEQAKKETEARRLNPRK